MPRGLETLSAWLAHLEQAHPKTIDLGLDRIRTVAQRSIKPSFSCPVITVAGTNGKGTTVAAIESMAMAKQLRVGTYTSPHLWRFNERIKINQMPVCDEDLMTAFECIEKSRGETSLTYFEFTTLAALWLFQQHPLDLIVLEVGMGGRLDATNIVDADIAIITSISFDHQAYLGNTLEAIASEKCGILRAGKPVICGEIKLASFIHGIANNLGAIFYPVDPKPFDSISDEFVASNLACAYQAMALLHHNIPIQALSTAVKKMLIPARGQICIYKNKHLMLDVAHNEASIQCLVERVNAHTAIHKILVLGVLEDKNMDEALKALCVSVDAIVLTTPQNVRGLSAYKLGQRLKPFASIITYVEMPAQAIEHAINIASKDDLVIVTGSFYTVSAFNPFL